MFFTFAPRFVRILRNTILSLFSTRMKASHTWVVILNYKYRTFTEEAYLIMQTMRQYTNYSLLKIIKIYIHFWQRYFQIFQWLYKKRETEMLMKRTKLEERLKRRKTRNENPNNTEFKCISQDNRKPENISSIRLHIGCKSWVFSFSSNFDDVNCFCC